MTDKSPKPPKQAPKGAVRVVRRKADWDAIERDYRTAKFTLRELETKHGADHSLILRKARKEEWKQDLGQAIKQATNAKLVEQLVTNEVTNNHQKVTDTIDVAATMGANVILGHRKGLLHITGIKALLLDQIQQAALHMPDLASVIEMVRNPDDNGNDRANDALKKAMGRSALVDDLKKLAEVDERVRKGEREAFNIESLADAQDNAKPKRIRLEFIDVESRAV